MWNDLYNLLLAAIRLRGQAIPLSRKRLWSYYFLFRIKNRWFQWLGIRQKTERFFGLKVHFADYKSFVYLFEEIFVHGIYYFRASSSTPLILDCGSNIGLSILYLKLIYPDARIVAFEAGTETFALLRENIESNKVHGVELHNVALSDHAGEIAFYPETQGSLSASVFEDRNNTSSEAVRIMCEPLSNFVLGPIDFMKMDIEGAEALCISEIAKSHKLGNIREMVIECHHNLRHHKTILTQVLPVLEAEGYSYQIASVARLPAERNLSQDVMIHAHQIGST